MNKLAIKEHEHTWYWASTESRSSNAWNQNFRNGDQFEYIKTVGNWARAVRRVKVYKSNP